VLAQQLLALAEQGRRVVPAGAGLRSRSSGRSLQDRCRGAAKTEVAERRELQSTGGKKKTRREEWLVTLGASGGCGSGRGGAGAGVGVGGGESQRRKKGSG
jgi:hypothetical protein